MFLLDTNVCIQYLSGRSRVVLHAFRQRRPETIFVCSVVKAEMYYGAMKSRDQSITLRQQDVFLRQFVSLVVLHM